jgi:hypothetical protein
LLREQRLHFAPQRDVVAAGVRQIGGTLLGRQKARLVIQRFDPLEAIGHLGRT